MSVYIDPETNCLTNKNWRWNVVTHLFADTLKELHEFAALLGLKRSWFQWKSPESLPHYDLSPNKRVEAIKRKVVVCDRREAVEIWRKLRKENLEVGRV